MNLRNIVVSILAVLTIIAGFMFSNFLATKKEQPPTAINTKYVPTVHTISVLNKPMQIPVSVSGTAKAIDEIDLFAEVQGVAIFDKTAFKTANRFKKGDVLLKIDDREFRLNVQAQRSRLANLIVSMIPDLRLIDASWAPKWEQFMASLKPTEMLPEWPTIENEKEQRFVNARALTETYFNIRSQEERLEKFVIYAPFDGMLTAVNVNRGALVRNGQNLGRLTGTGSMEVGTSVAVSDINYMQIGNEVRLASSQMNKEWAGSVSRISNRIDPSSQMVDVFIQLKSDTNLKDGLFLEGQIRANVTEEVFALARNLLLEDQYVYGVYEGSLKRYEVQPIKFFQDQVLVKGLDNGTVLLREIIAGAYDGMPVNLVN